MNGWRIVLAAALACGAPAAAAAQTPQGLGGDSALVNLVTITRLRDDFAFRPDEAGQDGHPTRPWVRSNLPVTLPEPFRSRAFTAESYVLLDVDSAGQGAGCRPLRAGAHPELDAVACTLLMRPYTLLIRPGYHFTETIPPPPHPPRGLLVGRWVMRLRWESLPAAVHRERDYIVMQQGEPPEPVRQHIRGDVVAADYRGIADQRISDGRVDAELVVNERGVPTGCRATRSSGNPAIDERTCAVLVRRARFAQRASASGTPVADTLTFSINVDWMLSSRPPLPQPVQVGQTVSGRLENGDRVAFDGTFYDDYTFTAPSPISVTISVWSAELSPNLRVTFDYGRFLVGEVARDSSGRVGKEVSLDLRAGERVRIRAAAYTGGTQGAYTLEVTAR
jgi:hypothetical protein